MQHFLAEAFNNDTTGFGDKQEKNSLSSYFTSSDTVGIHNQLGMPSINPNAKDSNEIIGDFPLAPKWEYQPGNRKFIQIPILYKPSTNLRPDDTLSQPINVRLIESYKQAIIDSQIRKELGVDYTP